jgi:hypothetical protein
VSPDSKPSVNGRQTGTDGSVQPPPYVGLGVVHQANVEVLRQRREAGLSTHPAHWAGFIASGDWH